MTRLHDIAQMIPGATLIGSPDVEIDGITHDSRLAGPGMIFVAMKGEKSDGNAHIPAALRAGAAAVMSEFPGEGPRIVAPDAREALGYAAAAVYGYPTRKFTLVGITGTNGKTTLTYLLESITQAAGGVPGVIGTISYRRPGSERTASHTTPEASELQAVCAEMAREGVTHVFMEVSSHGLHRGRVNGCAFDVGVFTNLTQDHLDYHGDIEEYYLAKRILFDKILPSSGKPAKAVVNADDSYGRRLFDEIAFPNKIRFGRSQGNEVHPELIEFDRHGIRGRVHTPQGTVRVRSELAGEFNISNISAAVAVGVSMGLSVDAIERGIEALTNVPGRLERVESHVGAIFVDYAHTPDAVKNVLAALQGMGDARIITIIGCGGDRDRAKRPLMGMEAARGSHFVILTSDNPRSEDALTILRAMEEGASEASTLSDEIKAHGYTVIPDRREAIAWAVQRLSENDVLLVAGKGHETYQEIKGVKYPFDDREVIREETAEAKAGRMGSERLR